MLLKEITIIHGVVMGERPSYDEYFMEMAHVVAKRSTCLRRKVGAILVKDKHICRFHSILKINIENDGYIWGRNSS